MTALIERMANRVSRVTGNRLIGAVATSAREQRTRLDDTIRKFERTVEASAARVETMARRMEKGFARSMHRVMVFGCAAFCLLVVIGGGAGWWIGGHLVGVDCRAVQVRQADGRP